MTGSLSVPRVLAVLLAMAAVAACTSTEVSSYERVQGSRVDQAYLQPGTDFSRYQRLYALPLEIYFPTGVAEPSADDLAEIRATFEQAFLARLGDDYALATEPAPDALGVRGSLIDLRNNPPGAELPVQGRLRSLVANGQLTFLMELSDSVSGDVLAYAGDRDEPSGKGVADPELTSTEDEARLGAAADYWAGLFLRFLDANLGPAGDD